MDDHLRWGQYIRHAQWDMQAIFTTVQVLVSKIIWCRYNFPEIKSPEIGEGTVKLISNQEVFDKIRAKAGESNDHSFANQTLLFRI
jgi:hypothetical protein